MQMRAVLYGGASFALLCVGFVMGVQSNDPPEVRVVKVPEVKTHVEFKDRQVPFPETCSRAAEIVTKLNVSDDKISEYSGQLLDGADAASGGVGASDIHKVNDAVTKIRAAKGGLEDILLSRAEVALRAQTTIDLCKEDLADGAP